MDEKTLNRITSEQRKITDFVKRNSISQLVNLGAYDGLGGALFYNSILYMAHQNVTEDELSYLIELGISQIEKKNNISNFSSGVAGFAWTLNFLNGSELIECTDMLNMFDEYLEMQCTDELDRNNVDLLNGAMGIGVYFIKRNKVNVPIKIIEYLDNCKEIKDNLLVWSIYKHRNSTRRKIYDTSLAHGLAGILYFLNNCYINNIERDKCKAFIEGILNTFTTISQDCNKVGSYFPNEIKFDGDSLLPHQQFSRLAWCYGDLGILYTILNTARILKNKDLETTTLNMLKETSKRMTLEETKVFDAGFCHGSIGVSFIYFQIYMLTGDSSFYAAFYYWLNKTLLYLDTNKNYECFYGSEGDDNLSPGHNFLEGIIGVGACLHEFERIDFRKESQVAEFLMLDSFVK